MTPQEKENLIRIRNGPQGRYPYITVHYRWPLNRYQVELHVSVCLKRVQTVQDANGVSSLNDVWGTAADMLKTEYLDKQLPKTLQQEMDGVRDAMNEIHRNVWTSIRQDVCGLLKKFARRPNKK